MEQMKNNKTVGVLILTAGSFIAVLFGGFTIISIQTLAGQIHGGHACPNPASNCPLPDIQGNEFYIIIGVVLSVIGIIIVKYKKDHI